MFYTNVYIYLKKSSIGNILKYVWCRVFILNVFIKKTYIYVYLARIDNNNTVYKCIEVKSRLFSWFVQFNL